MLPRPPPLLPYSAVTEQWLATQLKWLYLENIFLRSEDIRNRLPEQTKDFTEIDKVCKRGLVSTPERSDGFRTPRITGPMWANQPLPPLTRTCKCLLSNPRRDAGVLRLRTPQSRCLMFLRVQLTGMHV